MSSRIVVLISGSGSNLQAIIDASMATDYPGEVVGVISNKPEAYGLTRASNANIANLALSHKDFDCRENYDQTLM
ncbi:MAG: phosphoribosylglycinamide formyltransferase, partial [Colwellia sp.]|nr:phosphoribosylglycinamide formyltransferase [Colwellia sp.]